MSDELTNRPLRRQFRLPCCYPVGCFALPSASGLSVGRFLPPCRFSTPRRSIGLLLADPQGSQFFSTLEPLTKEQQQRIKAAAAAGGGGGAGGKKARESGKGKGKGEAAAAAAAAAADAGPSTSSAAKPAAPGGGSSAASATGSSGQVVGLCVLPIHLSKEGCGRPVDTLYYVPLTAGTWGGMRVKEEVAQQGRELAGQLLHAEQSVVAFGMQGGWGGWGVRDAQGASPCNTHSLGRSWRSSCAAPCDLLAAVAWLTRLCCIHRVQVCCA